MYGAKTEQAGEAANGPIGVDLLVEAGIAVAESLDLATTLTRVAQLTVPRLADLCVIDLSAEDGSITQMAVAAAEEQLARELESLRERQQLDPAGEHPVARVIRSGQAELLESMSDQQLESFAEGSTHARFMLEHGYRTAMVAPLLARRRTLGALSVLRLGDCEPYRGADLELVSELARRAALAIDNARLFAEVRRVEQRLEAILVNLAEAITMTDEDDRIVFANQAAADLLGADSAAALTGARQDEVMNDYLVLDEDGNELTNEQMPRRRLFAEGEAEPLLVRCIRRSSGKERWLIARPSAVRDPDGGRLLYAVNVYEDITEVKRREVAESFLAEATRVLTSSMDHAETLRRIARLAVPGIADWCAVDLLTEGGEIERVAVHHSDSGRLELVERLYRSYRPSPEQPGVPEVIRTGRSRIFPRVTPEGLAAHARDQEHLELLQAIEATSAIIVPLIAGTKTIGAITLVSSESARRLSRADVALAERLGRRAGMAVESARLYTERTRIASILQSALLPQSLPEIPGLELGARYHACGELNDVGGDFYDVFEHGPGRWLLAIGDVCGKGPQAAGVTALARHTLRAAAKLGQTPAGMLRALHEALREQPVGADLCTVCLITIERREGHFALTVALAGHPAPLLVDDTGVPTQLGAPGTLLGVLDPISISEVDGRLELGDTLILYTDGLPDADRAGQRLGEQRLMELCGQAPEVPLGVLLERIEQAALEHADAILRDDIALLAARPAVPASERPPGLDQHAA